MQSLTELYKAGRGPSSSHTMGPDRAGAALSRRVSHGRRLCRDAVWLSGKNRPGPRHRPCAAGGLRPPPALPLLRRGDGRPPPSQHDGFDGTAQGGGVGPMARHERGRTEPLKWKGSPPPRRPTSIPTAPLPTSQPTAKRTNCACGSMWHRWRGRTSGTFSLKSGRPCRPASSRACSPWARCPAGLTLSAAPIPSTTAATWTNRPPRGKNRLICAYAFAAGEQNAAGGTVVTAPTCGACGVLPAVLLYTQQTRGTSDSQVLRALAAGGLMGNLIKTNASISGAECGCQAEIGSACSMAAAALAEFYDMSLDQIEYSAEIAMEHHLGLTCDPIWGLVQIPCIERKRRGRHARAQRRAACKLSHQFQKNLL